MLCLNEVVVESFKSVRIRLSPIVDWHLCLRETPVTFTSRSPDIATLGSSYVDPNGSSSSLGLRRIDEVTAQMVHISNMQSKPAVDSSETLVGVEPTSTGLQPVAWPSGSSVLLMTKTLCEVCGSHHLQTKARLFWKPICSSIESPTVKPKKTNQRNGSDDE